MEIRKCAFGKGLFATQVFHKDDVLWTLAGPVYATPSRTTIQVAPDSHLDDMYGIYFNHSFTPNCRIDGRKVICISPIKKGDHLTFDYTQNETSISAPFQTTDGRWVN